MRALSSLLLLLLIHGVAVQKNYLNNSCVAKARELTEIPCGHAVAVASDHYAQMSLDPAGRKTKLLSIHIEAKKEEF
ncbi:unnamed protein product [Ilex paraguariensis]|uniref:Uncharacterized protein n=1 Tax=Ilex paraguariensis TaxID=185542 RepID=A0ABC8TN67_9AQUA